MQLFYNRSKLIGLASLATGLVAVIVMFVFGEFARQREALHMIAALIGPEATRLLMIALAIIAAALAARLCWLAANGGVAASIEPGGIRVQTVRSGVFLRWSDIAGLTFDNTADWGERPVVAIHRRGKASGLQALLGAGSKTVLPASLLRSDTIAIHLWLSRVADIRMRRPRKKSHVYPWPAQARFGRRG